jgi:hypothetical protein
MSSGAGSYHISESEVQINRYSFVARHRENDINVITEYGGYRETRLIPRKSDLQESSDAGMMLVK